MAAVAVVVAVIATPIGILANEYLVDFPTWMPGVPAHVSNGLVPLTLGLAGIWGVLACGIFTFPIVISPGPMFSKQSTKNVRNVYRS